MPKLTKKLLETLIAEEFKKLNENNATALKASGQLKVSLAGLLKAVEDFQNNVLKDELMSFDESKTTLPKLLQDVVDEVKKVADTSDSFIKVEQKPEVKPAAKKILVKPSKKVV
jgi:hypothetical protein